MKQLVLDAGALIALERGDRRVIALVDRSAAAQVGIAIPASVLAQVWRDGPRQARLAMLLSDAAVEVPTLDEASARLVGMMCGSVGHSDIVDVHVVLESIRRGAQVVTSDADDLRKIRPSIELVVL